EESDSLSLLLGSVAAGNGVALLPEHSQKMPHSGTIYVDLKTPKVHAEVLAVYKPNQPLGMLSLLLEELEKSAAAI
ncbi:MAG: LysR substrate-binding domain-containing protein, partial [Verrucomicrobiota bacterium]